MLLLIAFGKDEVMNFRKDCLRTIGVAILLFSGAIAHAIPANAQAGTGLRVVVVEGEGVTNNIAAGAVCRSWFKFAMTPTNRLAEQCHVFAA